MPSKSLGLAMNPAEFVEELKVRLWVPTFSQDHFCPCCDSMSDRHGLHARRCGAAGDWVACHNGARNICCRFADTAGLNPSLEQAHLLPPRPDEPTGTNLRRPADVFVPSWTHGQPAAFDVAITSPQRQEALRQAAQQAGSAACAYEGHKRSYLQTEEECRQQGILFIPLVAETSGGWGPSAIRTFAKWAKLSTSRGGAASSFKAALPQFLERLSVSIRAAKARAVLRRGPASVDAQPSCLEQAASALVAYA